MRLADDARPSGRDCYEEEATGYLEVWFHDAIVIRDVI